MINRFDNDPQIRCKCGELMQRNESMRQWECAVPFSKTRPYMRRCDEIVTDQYAADKRLGPYASIAKVDPRLPPPIPGYRWVKDGNWGYYERVEPYDQKSVYAKLIQDTARFYGKK